MTDTNVIVVNTELTKGYFTELAKAMTKIEVEKIRAKEIVDTAKESGIDVKLLKKAVALYVKESFEETVKLNNDVEEFYKAVTAV